MVKEMVKDDFGPKGRPVCGEPGPRLICVSNRTIKLRLYEANPHCYYCGQKMIMTNIQNIPKGQSLPDNAATLEHLVTRYSVFRWKRKQKKEQRKVLLVIGVIIIVPFWKPFVCRVRRYLAEAEDFLYHREENQKSSNH